MRNTFKNNWGKSPWRVDFPRARRRIPSTADFVVIGGGFSGLSAATWLARLAPNNKIVLIEAAELGAGASGRTGGMTLAETAGGNLPGLGDVLAGFAEILKELKISCDFLAHGAWEVGRTKGRKNSEISWKDAGRLRSDSGSSGRDSGRGAIAEWIGTRGGCGRRDDSRKSCGFRVETGQASPSGSGRQNNFRRACFDCDKCAIARAGGTAGQSDPEIDDGGRYSSVECKDNQGDWTRIAAAVLHGGFTILVGALDSRQPGDFWVRAGDRERLGRVAHTGCARRASGGLVENAKGTGARIASRSA